MSRPRRCLSAFALAWALSLAPAICQEGERPILAPAQVLRPNLQLRLSTEAALSNWLKTNRVPESAAAKDREAFAALPKDVQHAFAAVAITDYAQQAGNLKVLDKPYLVRLDPGKIALFLTPNLDGFAPGDGARDEVVMVLGSNFRSTSQVTFNGNPASTYWLSFWGNILAFRVPNAGVTSGSSYPVQVSNGTRTSGTVNFTVVAPRGYRGYHGWAFPNVGTAVVPWTVYRNYFGASAVEFGDGTHRPAAQAWYDSSYKGIGSGGNCYGMSLMSHRIKQWNITGLLHNVWWSTHRLASVWSYTSNQTNDQVWQSVQEMQGNQLAEPIHTLVWDRLNTQGANAAWVMAQGVVTQPSPHGCVIGVTGGGGHAIVPYRTEQEAGSASRRWMCYDNNVPYNTTEAGGPDRSIATTNQTGNTFTYGGYNRVGTWDMPEVLVTPSLPASAMGAGMGAAAQSAYLVVEKSARVTQITDELGNTFYAGTQENTGANRIPGAYYTPPIMGGPVPDTYPHTWLFTNATGKSFRVQLLAPGPEARVTFIQKGLVVEFASEGLNFTFTAAAVNSPDPRMIIGDTGGARLRRLRMIAIPNAQEERTFEMEAPNQQLQGGDLEIGLDATKSALRMVNRSNQAVSAQVTLRRDANNQHSATQALQIDVPAAQTGILRPGAWQNLQRQRLNLERQSLQGTRLDTREIPQ